MDVIKNGVSFTIALVIQTGNNVTSRKIGSKCRESSTAVDGENNKSIKSTLQAARSFTANHADVVGSILIVVGSILIVCLG